MCKKAGRCKTGESDDKREINSQVSDSNHLKIMHLTFNRQKVRMLIMCMVTWKSKQSTTRQNPKQGKLRWVYTPDKFGVRIRTALFLSFCS